MWNGVTHFVICFTLAATKRATSNRCENISSRWRGGTVIYGEKPAITNDENINISRKAFSSHWNVLCSSHQATNSPGHLSYMWGRQNLVVNVCVDISVPVCLCLHRDKVKAWCRGKKKEGIGWDIILCVCISENGCSIEKAEGRKEKYFLIIWRRNITINRNQKKYSLSKYEENLYLIQIQIQQILWKENRMTLNRGEGNHLKKILLCKLQTSMAYRKDSNPK